MTSHTDLTGLHVVALRYRDTYLASDDERGIDAYAASGVYERAGVPVKIGEPRLRDDVETTVACTPARVNSTYMSRYIFTRTKLHVAGAVLSAALALLLLEVVFAQSDRLPLPALQAVAHQKLWPARWNLLELK